MNGLRYVYSCNSVDIIIFLNFLPLFVKGMQINGKDRQVLFAISYLLTATLLNQLFYSVYSRNQHFIFCEGINWVLLQQ